MRIIQTFWSKPSFGTANGKGLQQSCGWCNPMYYYMSLALSCLSLRQFYDTVELYTDAAGKKLLVDELHLPYTAVHELPDDLDRWPIEMWAVGKLYTYRDQQEPFLHVDNDVFIWQRFPDNIEHAPLVAQNYERDMSFNRTNVISAMMVAKDIPPYMQRMANTDEANLGIFGGTDTDFIRRYADEALRFAWGNVDTLRRLRYPRYFNMVFEQYLLTCLAANEGREFTYVFDDVGDNFSKMVRFNQVPSPQWYIHPCGEWKKADWVGMAVAYHLHHRFPEAYRFIKKWYEEKEPASGFPLKDGEVMQVAKTGKPQLSVIIPAYNAELFVDRCLRSLQWQTYGGWEAIVVDDGSSDETAEEVERFIEKGGLEGIVRLVRQEHLGVSAARNRGLAEARGELIAFADADDYMHPQYLELMVQALDRHPEADLAMTLSVRTTRLTDASLQQKHKEADAAVGEGGMLRRALFLGHRHFTIDQCHTCHGKVMRRRIVDGLSFPETFSVYEDAVMMNRVFQRTGKFVMVRQRLYFWLEHPWSTLVTSDRGLLQGTRAYLTCLSDIPKSDSTVRDACVQRTFMHSAWMKSRYEQGKLTGVDEIEVNEAVKIPLRVYATLLFKSHLPFGVKWQLLTMRHSRRARERMEKRMKKKKGDRDQRAVGTAPVERNGLVSVVIPVYNIAPYLPACLDSVLAQRYQKLEIILVDDGSTDGSGDICEAYARKDGRIKVIHQENRGLSGARNTGLDQATGEYVIMPDGDDTLHPEMIRLLHKSLQQGDFPFAMVSAKDVEQPVAVGEMPPLTSTPTLRLLMQRDLFAALADNVDSHVVWNKLYRRSAIGKLRFEDTSSQDTVFNTRLFLRLPYAALVDAPLYYWLKRPGSLSRNFETPKSINRLYSFKTCADLTVGMEYESWFLELLYRYAGNILDRYHSHRLGPLARKTVRTIVRQTARRLLTNSSLPFTRRLKLFFPLAVKAFLCLWR